MIVGVRYRAGAGRRVLVTLLAAATTIGGCQLAPRPPASGSILPAADGTSSALPDGGGAIVSSPVTSVALPDGLDRIGWTWTDRQLDANGNATKATIVAGLLGATESFRLDGEGQAAVDGDVLVVTRADANGSTIESYRIASGERIGQIDVAGLVAKVAIHAASGAVYDSRMRVGVGLEVHRSALDGSGDVLLLDLGPNHARDGMPNGTDMFDYGVASDGTFVAEACDAAGCAVHVAKPGDQVVTSVPLPTGVPALCNVIGVSPPFLVVYDSQTCFADSEDAKVPARVIELGDGSNRVLNAGPNFEATGLVTTGAGPQVIVRQRLGGQGRSLSLVDVASGAQRIALQRVPTSVDANGELVSYAPARIDLPAGWILLVPNRFEGPMADPPSARLINVIDGRTVEIPSWPQS